MIGRVGFGRGVVGVAGELSKKGMLFSGFIRIQRLVKEGRKVLGFRVVMINGLLV